MSVASSFLPLAPSLAYSLLLNPSHSHLPCLNSSRANAGGMEGGRKGKCVCEREGAREDEHVLSESERDRERWGAGQKWAFLNFRHDLLHYSQYPSVEGDRETEQEVEFELAEWEETRTLKTRVHTATRVGMHETRASAPLRRVS
mmetsp:Transcript_58742/g.94909  ORF Transcript_58742/g.94909 Transcript_58742/m.94909 type:complete len:145 (-) Transcript_58742:40-474(-)